VCREKSKSLEKTLPKRSLGPSNYSQTFRDGSLIVDLEFVHYRNTKDPKLEENIKLASYNNYHPKCMLYNLDDVTRGLMY